MLLKPNQIFLSNGKHPCCSWGGGTKFFPGGTQSGAYLGVCGNSPLERFPVLVLINCVFSSILRSKLKYFDEEFLLYFCNFHQVLIEEKV